MLNVAGFDRRDSWISSRDNAFRLGVPVWPYDRKRFPYRKVRSGFRY